MPAHLAHGWSIRQGGDEPHSLGCPASLGCLIRIAARQQPPLDVPRLSSARCQASPWASQPCLLTLLLSAPALTMCCDGLDPASSKHGHHFQAVPTLGPKYCHEGQRAPGGCVTVSCPKPHAQRSHSVHHTAPTGER